MASVEMTITYNDEIGTPADMGETLTLLASFPGLNPEKFSADFCLKVGDNDAPIPPAMMGGLMGTLTDLPIGVKASLKLAVSRDKFGVAENVGDALRELGGHEGLLLSKIAMSVAVRDEAQADRLIADLEMYLAERPYSVSVAFDKIAPGHFRHGSFERRTPIDEAIRKAGGAITELTQRPGIESVTLSSRHGSVTLTSETREKGAELLRRSIAGE